MTSMPASRSARAMIFAPRSCPSRPGLATTTRILRVLGLAAMAAQSRSADDLEGHPHVRLVHAADDPVGADAAHPPAVVAAVLQRRVELHGAAGHDDVVEVVAAPDPA